MKKESIISAYFSMWKNIFNYKDKASKREYWVPFFVHLALIVIVLFLSLSLDKFSVQPRPLLIVIIVLLVFLVVSIIPWIALCVRIARSFGGASWWRILFFAIGVGAIIFLISFFSWASDFYTLDTNRPETVYGPPEWFETPVSESSYDPEENILEDVYGPPEWFEEDDTSVVSDQEEYDPADNEPETVYGPPEWFE